MEIIWNVKIPIRSSDDRRQSDRVFINARVVCHLEDSSFKAVSEDLSMSGIRIRTPKLLPVGSTVKIEIFSPFDDKLIHIEAQVIWSKRVGDKTFAGLKHIKISPEDITNFYELLAQTMLEFLFSIEADYYQQQKEQKAQ